MLSDRASVRTSPVHMVFVNRGNSLGGLPAALRAMSNVRAWARRPKRLHFHLLADEQQHGAVSAMTTLGAQAGLPLTVHNASDAALQVRLPPLGLATLHHAALQGKPRLYTAPKLFLHALLDLQSVLVIDTDILVMADVCELWDAKLTRAPRGLRRVRTGYAYQPPALGTYRTHRAACPRAPRTVRTEYRGNPGGMPGSLTRRPSRARSSATHASSRSVSTRAA